MSNCHDPQTSIARISLPLIYHNWVPFQIERILRKGPQVATSGYISASLNLPGVQDKDLICGNFKSEKGQPNVMKFSSIGVIRRCRCLQPSKVSFRPHRQDLVGFQTIQDPRNDRRRKWLRIAPHTQDQQNPPCQASLALQETEVVVHVTEGGTSRRQT